MIVQFGTMVSDSLELLKVTASQKEKIYENVTKNVRPSSRDGCEVILEQVPTTIESEIINLVDLEKDYNCFLAKICEAKVENSRQKAELAVYEDKLKRLVELNVEMKKNFLSLFSKISPQLELLYSKIDLQDGPQQTRLSTVV